MPLPPPMTPISQGMQPYQPMPNGAPPPPTVAQPPPAAQPPPDMKKKMGPDMINRDPNDINDHLKVEWEDVIAEPDGAHSIDCVWRLSWRCFTGSKNCCYRTLTLFCGCFYALCWGCQFACITFAHIWQCTPTLRIFAINCGFLQKCWGTALQCLLAPCCETMGLCLSRIQVTNFGGVGDFK